MPLLGGIWQKEIILYMYKYIHMTQNGAVHYRTS